MNTGLSGNFWKKEGGQRGCESKNTDEDYSSRGGECVWYWLLTDQGLEWKAGPGAWVDSQPAAQVVQPSAHVLQPLLVPVQLLVQQPEPQRHGR